MAAGLRCGQTTIKYLLFFFNFLFTLCGLAIVIIGAVAASNMPKNGNTIGNSLIFTIVLGAIIFLIAFFGCCGAVRESHCMLVTFGVLLLVVLVCEIVVASLIFISVKNGEMDSVVDNVFKRAKDGDEAAEAATDVIQQAFQCCGLTDASFWGSAFPPSCCTDNASPCTKPFPAPCKNNVTKFINSLGKAAGALAIAVAVIEVIGVWFALALAGEIKKLSRG